MGSATAHPLPEAVAIATHRMGIAGAPVEQSLVIGTLVEHGISYGDSANRIVGETTLVCKQLEVFFRSWSKLKS